MGNRRLERLQRDRQRCRLPDRDRQRFLVETLSLDMERVGHRAVVLHLEGDGAGGHGVAPQIDLPLGEADGDGPRTCHRGESGRGRQR